MLSRREMVGKLAAGAAGAAVAWTASAGRASAALRQRSANPQIGSRQGDSAVNQTFDSTNVSASDSTNVPASVRDLPAPKQEESKAAPPPAVAPPPWELLHPLAVGSVLAYGWRVADLSGPADGACVLTLQNERGRSQRVHVCRNDGHPEGLVYTDRFDLVVMNGGRGDLRTEEGLAQAIAEVAHALAANEAAARRTREVATLLPHAERMRQFAVADSGWTLR